MFGHEHVKASLLAYLAVAVPERLEMLRTLLEVDTPVDPAAYTPADSLTTSTEFPVVLVRSTSMDKIESAGVVRAGQPSGWMTRYQVELGVACDSSTHGSYEAACTDRDRLLWAVRGALLLAGDVGDGVSLVKASITEATGAYAESFQGRPLAYGSLTLAVNTAEVLLPVDIGTATETILAVDATTTGYDAGQVL